MSAIFTPDYYCNIRANIELLIHVGKDNHRFQGDGIDTKGNMHLGSYFPAKLFCLALNFSKNRWLTSHRVMVSIVKASVLICKVHASHYPSHSESIKALPEDKCEQFQKSCLLLYIVIHLILVLKMTLFIRKQRNNETVTFRFTAVYIRL